MLFLKDLPGEARQNGDADHAQSCNWEQPAWAVMHMSDSVSMRHAAPEGDRGVMRKLQWLPLLWQPCRP